MQYSSPTTSSSSSSSSSQGQLSNNVLLLPSNTSKMSFIIPSNTTNVGQQQNVSSANILSSSSNSGMTTPPITLNGTTSTANSGQISQQRLLLSQRSQSQPISQEEFQKILRALQDNNMNESAEIFKKEYQSLFNKTISSFSEPYFTALDGYISYVQEQPDTSRHEFSQLIYPLFVHMYL
jgi:hypothetical protein